MVFAATGSASFDFYGVNRHGDNLFANCVLALDARTGKRVWHFQGVKHDVWDWDFPAAPSLVTVTRDGRTVDAVAQITKTRLRLRPRSRRPARRCSRSRTARAARRRSTARSSPRRSRIRLQPPPFARQGLTEDMLTTRTPEAHAAVLARVPHDSKAGFVHAAVARGHDRLSRASTAAPSGAARRSIPRSALLYVNSNEMPWIVRADPEQRHVALQQRSAPRCHRDGSQRHAATAPSLVGIGKR